MSLLFREDPMPILFCPEKLGPLGQVKNRWLCLGVLCLKSKIPSTKLQINHKFQITNSKPVQRAAKVLAPRERLFFLFGVLNFGHCFLFVFWDLLFGISISQ
jgi:hypothetical protein